MKLQEAAERAAGGERNRGSKHRRAGSMTVGSVRPQQRLEIKKILVPVDFSEPCNKALQYAINVASEFGAELILLHVVQPYPILPDLPAATAELNAALGKDAVTSLQKLAMSVKGIALKQVIRSGNPAREIADEAEKQGADLIIINTHGRTGLAHLFIGSVAEHVVRLAKCPVLTFREHGRNSVKVAGAAADRNRVGARDVSI